jgi:hypothetical protein
MLALPFECAVLGVTPSMPPRASLTPSTRNGAPVDTPRVGGGFCSGLERSDFVLWPTATEIHVDWHVRDQDESGLVVLNVSFVARDPERSLAKCEIPGREAGPCVSPMCYGSG